MKIEIQKNGPICDTNCTCAKSKLWMGNSPLQALHMTKIIQGIQIWSLNWHKVTYHGVKIPRFVEKSTLFWQNATLADLFNMMLRFAQKLLMTWNCPKIMGFQMRYVTILCRGVPASSEVIYVEICEKMSFLLTFSQFHAKMCGFIEI